MSREVTVVKLLSDAADRQIFTVSELTRNIRLMLEDNFSGIWVEGEISNFKFHSSGHMYFSVKDEGSQLACVMFRADNMRLGFEPGDGMSVLCYGRVSVYPVRGQYQFYVERIEPKGAGALQLRFEKLKAKLKEEGLFDEARKRAIPYLPKRIGIVTSADGAALQDILNVLNRRFQNVELLIASVPVQGPQAAPVIAAAIEDLNEYGGVDVLIVGRGGGSLEDLWAFNEEVVARAIFNSSIPVISAVGHEVDFTIADFVADLRAATPSAAAEMVLPLREELVARIVELKTRAYQSVRSRIKELRLEVESLVDSRALKDPLGIFEIQSQRVDELTKALKLCFTAVFSFHREKLSVLIGKLETLGPLATLHRGFSVSLAEPQGKIISSFKQLKVGDSVKTKLKEGFFISTVKEIHA